MIAFGAFEPDWVSAPGETVRDILHERGITERQLAAKLEDSLGRVTRLIEGREPITPDLARKLESSLGATAAFWLAREKRYRDGLRNLARSAEDKSTREWVRALPLKDMARLGWIPDSEDPQQIAVECLRFFGVRDLDAWRESYKAVLQSAVFRTSATFESKPGAVAAWLRRGEQESALIDCQPWNPKKFCAALDDARALTREADPDKFLPKLKTIFASCGVALVTLRAPAGCRASGAARFIMPEKALMLLSFRYLSDDQFWFSVFHEAAHLVLHHDKVMVDAPHMPSTEEEQEANAFAVEALIPAKHRDEMLQLPVDGRAVIRFARRAGIAPGIVVGQMQHLGKFTRRQLNNLKRRYQWVEDD
jgi:HTH-type transcriptional regulator / antitoxin HigA